MYGNTGPLFLTLLVLTLVCSPSVNGLTDTKKTPFPVPGHGEVVFQVPSDWDYTYLSLGEKSPPVITFYRKDKSGKELFQLNVSLLWDDGYKRNILSDEHIRGLVAEVGEDILPFSDETELILEPIEGQDGRGYRFDLSDSSARPGEYRYLTQGALGVGELLLVFSLFTNDTENLVREKTLEMIRTALHRLQRHVLNLPESESFNRTTRKDCIVG